MKRSCAVVAMACIAAALSAPGARAAETPARFRVKSFADVMPPTTIFYLEIPDYARARAAYRATPRWKLWWEGAGRRLISQLIRSEDDDEWTAAWRAFADAAAIPTGKVAFAIDGPDPEDEFGMPMSSFMAEAGGRARDLTGLIKKTWGLGMVEEDETVIQRVRFEEVDELLIGSEGGLAMAGFGRTGLNGLLSRFEERPWQNLSGNPAYKLAKARALEGAHFTAFTNFTDIWRMVAMEFGEDWAPIEATGLPQLAATSFSGRFTPEGVVDKIAFILRGRARGMWELMRPEPLSRKAWALLPDFTSGFVAVKLPERAQPYVDLLRAVDPELAADFLEQFIEFREETGINFEQDILRLTTGEFTAVFLEEAPRRESDRPAGRRPGMMMGDEKFEKFLRHVILLVELKSPEKARAAMDRLVAADGGIGEPIGRKRRFGQLEGWDLGDDAGPHMYVSGSGGFGMLAFSSEPIERIAEHIAKRGPRLVDSAEFRKATAWIPADTGFAAYSNVRKVLKGFHALMSSETEMMAGEPLELPKAEELMADLSPLTACVRIEKPGFAFEIHSPDGFWPFYFQLMAHCFWRFEEEPMQERERVRAPGLPPVTVADADPETTKAYADLRKRLAMLKTPHIRIAELERHLREFRGTLYEPLIELAIAREKETMLRGAYAKAMATVHKMKAPAHRVAFLRTQRPVFAGTRYEARIMMMIEREMARAAADGVAVPDPGRAGAARVLAVRRDVDLVMISAGREDGVKVGARFGIYRAGTRIGAVEVEKVFTDMSSARIAERVGGARIRERDEARPEEAPPGGAPEPIDEDADDVF
ncbi:MAG: hypothetical protein ACYTKD_13540 [Planctomycetota bacterium]|jgi:hypothetical protein